MFKVLKFLAKAVTRFPRINFLCLTIIASALIIKYIDTSSTTSAAYQDDTSSLAAMETSPGSAGATETPAPFTAHEELRISDAVTESNDSIHSEQETRANSLPGNSIITDHLRTEIPTRTSEINQPASEEAPLLDIPLAADVQRRTLEVCEDDLQEFALLMSIAYWETRGDFVVDGIGDNGLSYGLYQINTRWHTERAAEFGYTVEDLLDPVKCAIVARDYLHELMDTYQKGSHEVTHYLFMLYNMGPGNANNAISHSVYSTSYSRAAMECYERYLAKLGLT